MRDAVYGPGYVRWAADHETDEVRRDLALELLYEESQGRKLRERVAALTTLVRLGFLVRYHEFDKPERRIRPDDVKDPDLRMLLFEILMAPDAEAAIEKATS